jgi:hypothetical protein
MAKIRRLKPEQRDNLVAYLDNELSPEESSEIDQALIDSPVARHEVEMLTRTWEMLELLPNQTASDEFTATTMQTVRLSEESQPTFTIEDYYPQIRAGVMAVAWLVCVTLASWAGFMIANVWTPNPADQLIDDLPVIQNYDQYRSLEVDDAEKIEFLKELDRRRLLDE